MPTVSIEPGYFKPETLPLPRRELRAEGAGVVAGGAVACRDRQGGARQRSRSAPVRLEQEGRQFAVMDAKGRYAAYTGPKATEWAGHKGGTYCTAQGNILAGEAVVAAMVEAFEKSQGHLSMRLMAALDAGQTAGGDKRGMQSAAMVIVKRTAAPG